MKPPRGKLAEPRDVSCRGGWSSCFLAELPSQGASFRGEGRRVSNPGRSPPSPAPGRLVRPSSRGSSASGFKGGVSIRERPLAPRMTAGKGDSAVRAAVAVARIAPARRKVYGVHSGTCPTRLETRTKESDACASRRVFSKPHGAVKARGFFGSRGRDPDEVRSASLSGAPPARLPPR